MPRVASRVLRVAVRLVVDALTVVNGGAGAGGALLLHGRLLVRVTERRVDGQVVVGAVHLPGDSPHTTSHRTLRGQPGERRGGRLALGITRVV